MKQFIVIAALALAVTTASCAPVNKAASLGCNAVTGIPDAVVNAGGVVLTATGVPSAATLVKARPVSWLCDEAGMSLPTPTPTYEPVTAPEPAASQDSVSEGDETAGCGFCMGFTSDSFLSRDVSTDGMALSQTQWGGHSLHGDHSGCSHPYGMGVDWGDPA